MRSGTGSKYIPIATNLLSPIHVGPWVSRAQTCKRYIVRVIFLLKSEDVELWVTDFDIKSGLEILWNASLQTRPSDCRKTDLT